MKRLLRAKQEIFTPRQVSWRQHWALYWSERHGFCLSSHHGRLVRSEAETGYSTEGRLACCSLFSFCSWQKCTFSAQLVWRLSLKSSRRLRFFFCVFLCVVFLLPLKGSLLLHRLLVAPQLNFCRIRWMDGWMDSKKTLLVCRGDLRIWMRGVCVNQAPPILKPLNKLCGATETHSSDTGLISRPPSADC